jgi:hypothetical protein
VLELGVAAQGLALDVACFGLDASRQAGRRTLHDLLQPAAHAVRRRGSAPRR